MLLPATKWHETCRRAQFVKSSFKSASHEVARDWYESTICDFEEDRNDTKKLLITTRNGPATTTTTTTTTGTGDLCPLLGENAIHGNAMQPLQGYRGASSSRGGNKNYYIVIVFNNNNNC